MNIVTLDYIKLHTRIDTDDEDTLLELYANAAEQTMLNDTWRTLDSLYDEFGEIPAPLKVAVCMLVEAWYINRTPVGSIQMYVVPYGYESLIKPYRIES